MLSSITLAVFGLATLGKAHMIMSSPTPFGKSSLNNSPLDASGSDFPCKQRPGVYSAEGASNTWPLGSTQSLSFTGSATHGGGSCQVSISYDKAPTKDSTWKVIHSIEGGCPIKGVAGNNGDNANAVNPDTYSFKVPSNLPTGTAVMAWTWFNKIGNREMYMNCAPITLTGGSSKRSEEFEFEDRNATLLMERDESSFNALPNMFVANIPSASCLSVDSSDLAFPNPGDSLVQLGLSTAKPSPPTGPLCGATGSTPQPTGSTSGVASTPKPTQKPTSKGAGIPGGVFATVPAPEVSQAKQAPVTSAAPVVSTAPVVVPSPAPVAPVPSPVAVPNSPKFSPGIPIGSTGPDAAQVAGSACTTEGMFNCIGGKSFQQCGSGTWSVVQQLAAGTTCAGGQSSAMAITAIGSKSKRAIRFSSAHVRRHLHKS
ncbi:related to spore coat protein SP96 precursor [Rhynchosporium secalis]|uniref:Related to spore coat protein SP96 n=1 Tax=Rhynchosporium secalis TaxID=38038 RepID=A0A1E1MKG9_RHYSE|nr:related to spore coat protein SP96 precursor [Rhynchosporium secalis]